MKALSILTFLLLIYFQSISNADTFSISYTVFKENGKVGLKNETGEVLIPAQYEEIGWSNGQFSLVNNVTGFRNGKLWGLVNLENHRVTKQEFDELLPSENGLIIAKKKIRTSVKALTGCINTSGKEIIPFQYDGLSIEYFRAIVFTRIGNDFKFGVVDLSNKTIIPQQFQEIKPLGSLRFAVKNFDNKISIYSDQGKQITPFTIDSLSNFFKNNAFFFEGSYKGVIDRDGQIRVPAKYRDITFQEDGQIKVKQFDLWYLRDGKNAAIQQCEADSVVAVSPSMYKLMRSGISSLANERFEEQPLSKYADIGRFKSGISIFKINGRRGVISADGTVIIPANFSEIQIEQNGIIAKQTKGNQVTSVLFDHSGNQKTVKAYEAILPFGQDFFAVKNRNHWGVIDRSGSEIVATVYDSLIEIKDDLIVVKFHGVYGIINTAEKWIVTPKSNRLKLLGHERFLEYKQATTELKSLNGNVIYFTENPIQPFEDYVLEKTSGGDIWKIDFNGIIVDRQYYPNADAVDVYEESEGYRVIKRNGRYGFVDLKGRLRIANRYEDVRPFKEGHAAVKILGKWGFINLHDNLSVQPVFEEVTSFTNGRAFVKQKGLYGVIDTRGKIVLPIRYEKIIPQPSNNLVIISGGLQGIAGPDGTVLISPRYDKLIDTGSEYVIVEKGGKFGVVGYNGISTIPMVYDYIQYHPYEKFFLVMQRKDWELLKI